MCCHILEMVELKDPSEWFLPDELLVMVTSTVGFGIRASSDGDRFALSAIRLVYLLILLATYIW